MKRDRDFNTKEALIRNILQIMMYFDMIYLCMNVQLHGTVIVLF